MDQTDFAGPGRTILAALKADGFPVDPKPYCVIGDRIGLAEVFVLETVVGLRMDGTIERLGATFSDDRCSTLSDDDLALVDLLAGDLPMSEDPYAELAAELVRRGVDADEAWVLGRIEGWLADGVMTGIGVAERGGR